MSATNWNLIRSKISTPDKFVEYFTKMASDTVDKKDRERLQNTDGPQNTDNPQNTGRPQTDGEQKITQRIRAGENINGGKAVYIKPNGKLFIYDVTDASCYGRYIGVAETSTNENDMCTVLINGASEILGSRWKKGEPYYIGTNGILTDEPPVVGLVRQVGIGINEDKILIVPHAEFEIIN